MYTRPQQEGYRVHHLIIQTQNWVSLENYISSKNFTIHLINNKRDVHCWFHGILLHKSSSVCNYGWGILICLLVLHFRKIWYISLKQISLLKWWLFNRSLTTSGCIISVCTIYAKVKDYYYGIWSLTNMCGIIQLGSNYIPLIVYCNSRPNSKGNINVRIMYGIVKFKSIIFKTPMRWKQKGYIVQLILKKIENKN